MKLNIFIAYFVINKIMTGFILMFTVSLHDVIKISTLFHTETTIIRATLW